jgi:hypothetical protein
LATFDFSRAYDPKEAAVKPPLSFFLCLLKHNPEKWIPKDHAQTKGIKREDDSKKSHPALAAMHGL